MNDATGTAASERATAAHGVLQNVSRRSREWPLTFIVHYPTWITLHENGLATWSLYMEDDLHAGKEGGANLILPGIKAVLDR